MSLVLLRNVCSTRSSLSSQCQHRLRFVPSPFVSTRAYAQKQSPKSSRPQQYDSQSKPLVQPSTRSEASATAASSTSASSIYPLTPPDSPASALNPPPCARPPPLNVPSWDNSSPVYKNYYRRGKSYLSFYKSGLKQIKQSFSLVRQLRSSSPSTRTRSSIPPWYYPSSARFATALKSSHLTRAEYQLLKRFRADAARFPFFILLFIACGEFTPLLVPFVSPIIPRTLWLPTQEAKAAEKREGRLPGPERTRKRDTFQVLERLAGYEGERGVRRVEEAGKDELRQVVTAGKKLGAWGRWMDPVIRNRIVPLRVAKGWVGRKAEEMRLDDWAIERDGGSIGLVGEEVKMAVEKRGVDVRGRTDVELRMILAECIKINRKNWSKELEDALRVEKIGRI